MLPTRIDCSESFSYLPDTFMLSNPFYFRFSIDAHHHLTATATTKQIFRGIWKWTWANIDSKTEPSEYCIRVDLSSIGSEWRNLDFTSRVNHKNPARVKFLFHTTMPLSTLIFHTLSCWKSRHGIVEPSRKDVLGSFVRNPLVPPDGCYRLLSGN